MKKHFIALVLGAVWSGVSVYAQYVFDEKFTVLDGVGRTYAIDIEENSHYSHGHSKVINGVYTILVTGNRHWLNTPELGDFTLKADWSAETIDPRNDDKIGIEFYFRRNRAAGGGSVLRFDYDHRTQEIRLSLNGRQIAERKNATRDDLRNAFLELEVKGTKARIKTCGIDCSFDVPSGRGRVAFDIVPGRSCSFALASVYLASPESPVEKPFIARRIMLPNVQGFQEPLWYDVSVSKCAGGGTYVSYELSGGIASCGERIQTGGTEWTSCIERIDSPYIKLTDADGCTRKVYLWNGVRQFRDERVQRFAGKNPKPWPFVGAFYLPDEFSPAFLTAGYEYSACNPWRFAANGPYERIVKPDGSDVYLGKAIEGDVVAVNVLSPQDKRIVGMIPKDLPRYEAALDHAKREHYFFESERVGFTVETYFRDEAWQEHEIDVKTALVDVYGRTGAFGAELSKDRKVERLPGGIVKVSRKVELTGNPGIGVWKLLVDVKSGPMPKMQECIIFEVLGDDPDSLCPPLASGLPTFVSMPSEIKYLEQNAFDPWAAFGGVGHYYSVDNRYPKVGNALQIWRLLPIYRRKWWCWNRRRNSDNIDMYGQFQKDLLHKLDIFGGYDNRRHNLARYELGALWHYIDDQLKMLRDYVVERRPNLKKLTPERANMLVATRKNPDFEDIKEIFESGWDEFKAYCRPRIEANEKIFTDFIYSIKTNASFATYGPHAFYLSHYKTAYALDYGGYPIEKDPRVRVNGSFWVFEEYHHSCDYPVHRPSLFVATYDYHFGYGRRIFPEIYYSSWGGRSLDGAVYNAHPDARTHLAATHQRRIAYRYVYGTPHFKNGKFGYWTDDGFHARNPERETMEEFVYAWKNVVEHRPVRPPRSAFLAVDFDMLRRHGEYFETETNTRLHFGEQLDICNTGEEALAYAHDRCIVNGYTTPVVCSAVDFDAINPEIADFVVLPPIEKGTPRKVLDSIRRMHARGVNLLATEAVVGLEDLFGVEINPGGERKVGRIGQETFTHKMAKAKYRSAGAKVVLSGAVDFSAADDIPLVFMHEKGAARTAFVNVPPTVIRRSTFRNGYHFGQEALSEEIKRAYRDILGFLAPNPTVKADKALVSGAYTKDGTFVVVVSEESPIYNDTQKYPKSVRFTVRLKDVGKRKISADAPYTVVSRTDDEVTLRTPIDKDTALFFRFSR